jgi:hypothetical protein
MLSCVDEIHTSVFFFSVLHIERALVPQRISILEILTLCYSFVLHAVLDLVPHRISILEILTPVLFLFVLHAKHRSINPGATL